MNVYELCRAGGGRLATRVALVHSGYVARPILAVDTGSVYTLVEPSFLAALGFELTRPIDRVDVVGVGGESTPAVFCCRATPLLWYIS